jgi:hypothetical protein
MGKKGIRADKRQKIDTEISKKTDMRNASRWDSLCLFNLITSSTLFSPLCVSLSPCLYCSAQKYIKNVQAEKWGQGGDLTITTCLLQSIWPLSIYLCQSLSLHVYPSACFQPLILSCSLYATDSSYTHPIYMCVMPRFSCLSTWHTFCMHLGSRLMVRWQDAESLYQGLLSKICSTGNTSYVRAGSETCCLYQTTIKQEMHRISTDLGRKGVWNDITESKGGMR